MLNQFLQLWRRLLFYLRRDQFDRELAEEMKFHLELKAEENLATGMSPQEAHLAARRQFGNQTLLREVSREMWGVKSIETLFQDLRYGVRMLLKQPGFTLTAVLTLTLGIGANTAIFSLLDAVLLKSLPVQKPHELVLFGKGEAMGATDDFPNRSWDLFSYPFYREVQQRTTVFSEVAALLSIHRRVHVTVNSAGEAEQLDVQLVSGAYFPVLGVNARLGRVFSNADDQTPGAHPVVVISHGWWERRLGGDPAAIGKTITIDKTAYTIIGVAPPEFFGTTVGEAPELWAPLAMNWKGREDREFQSLHLIARLKHGVSVQQAAAAVNLQFKQWLRAGLGAQPAPERLQDIQRASIELTSAAQGLSSMRRRFSFSLQILMVVVGVVLLIACANIANLLLARAAARQKEFAVRLALGAGNLRLIRQLLTESLLLAALGGAAGIALAWWGSRLLVLMASDGAEALPLNVTPDARILGFTLLASLASALVFGVAPALSAARIAPNAALNSEKGARQTAAQGWLGKSLVVAQVAFSLVLLIGAGLFVRTLINLQNVPTGFNQQNVLLFQIGMTTTGYKDVQLSNLVREVEEKVKTVPGVQAASFASFIFNQGVWRSAAYTRDFNPSPGQGRNIRNIVVGQEYFAAMEIPLAQGRGFGPQDTKSSQKVAVISETMARRFFGESSPLGKRFGINGPASSEQIEVIGVAKDAKGQSVTEAMPPVAYYHHAQQSESLNNFVVRYTGASATLAPQIRQAIKQVNSNLPIDEVVSLSEHIGRSLVQQRLIARLASFFGLLALLLACVGLYGVLSYTVARRTNEIGIRVALGAQPRGIVVLMMREVLLLVALGAGIGLTAAMATTRLVSNLLFGLTPTDPLTIVMATLLLISVTALAGYLPARRASRVDPLVALRND